MLLFSTKVIKMLRTGKRGLMGLVAMTEINGAHDLKKRF